MGIAVVVVVVVGFAVEMVVVVDVLADSGTHWEYQSLTYLQAEPATQVLGPV